MTAFVRSQATPASWFRCACSYCGSHNLSRLDLDRASGRCHNCDLGDLTPVLDAGGLPVPAPTQGLRPSLSLPFADVFDPAASMGRLERLGR